MVKSIISWVKNFQPVTLELIPLMPPIGAQLVVISKLCQHVPLPLYGGDEDPKNTLTFICEKIQIVIDVANQEK